MGDEVASLDRKKGRPWGAKGETWSVWDDEQKKNNTCEIEKKKLQEQAPEVHNALQGAGTRRSV